MRKTLLWLAILLLFGMLMCTVTYKYSSTSELKIETKRDSLKNIN